MPIENNNHPEGSNPKDLMGSLKPDMSLIPPVAGVHCALAMMEGARKYGPYNWRDKKIQARVYVAAAQRHLAQFLDGEDCDPLSGAHHLGHAMACCAILLDAIEGGHIIDNRPIKGKASDVIRKHTATQQAPSAPSMRYYRTAASAVYRSRFSGDLGEWWDGQRWEKSTCSPAIEYYHLAQPISESEAKALGAQV